MNDSEFSLERPRKRWLFFVLLLLILLGLFRSAWLPRFLDGIQPILQSVNTMSQAVGGIFSGGSSSVTQTEYERLLFENRQYQRRLKAMDVVIAENKALRNSLLLSMPKGFDKVTAEVILRPSSHWFESFQIDKGFEEGLSVNQVVMNAEGVIGKLSNVTARTARVQLVSHPEHTVSVVVGKQRVPGVLSGRFRGRPAQLRYLQNYAKIQAGAQVLTSGLGGVYPPDLPLGDVLSVQKDAARPVPDATVRLLPLEQRLRFVVILIPNEDEHEPNDKLDEGAR